MQRPRIRHLTVADIERRLKLSHMVLTNWRNGMPDRTTLKCFLVPKGPSGLRHEVRIYEHHLRQYLTAYRPDLLRLWDSQDDLDRADRAFHAAGGQQTKTRQR